MNNPTPVSPENLFEANEQICAKLLGWTPSDGGWLKNDGYMYGGCGTPSFTTWAEAGLILDALINLGIGVDVGNSGGGWYCDIYSGLVPSESTGPLAVRAAALQYIRSLP
jgi:hypothetical protein